MGLFSGIPIVGAATDWAWGGLKDTFTTDDNQAPPQFGVSDWAYGGSGENAAALRSGMGSLAERGEGVMNQYASSARQMVAPTINGLASAANQSSQIGQQASTAGRAMADTAGRQFNETFRDSYGAGQRLNDLSSSAMTAGRSQAADQATSALLQFGMDPGRQTDWSGMVNRAEAAGGTGAPGSATERGVGGLLSAGSAGPGEMSSQAIGSLRDFATSPGGPSAAEAQMRQGLDTSAANAMALASSGRGRAQSGAALQQAQAQQAAAQQETVAQTASLRAQEEAARRGQNLEALQTAGQLGVSADTAALERNLQANQAAAGYLTQAEQVAQQQKLAGILGAGGLQAEMERARATGDTTRLQALQSAAQTGIASQSNILQGLGLSGDLASSMGQYSLGMQQANDAQNQAWMSAMLAANQYGTQGALQGAQAFGGFYNDIGNQWLASNSQAMQAAAAGQDIYNSWIGRGYDTYDQEQQLRAALAQERMRDEASIRLGNQQADIAGDASIAGMVGGIGGAALGLL